VKRLRTMRSRLALLIALAVLGSVVVFAVFTATAFFLHERSEARSRAFTPETRAAEDTENRELVLAVGGSMVLALALTVPAAAVLGRWLATRALAPMREAAARARAAGVGTERLQLPVRGLGDEWDELAAVMNDLLAHQHQSIVREKAFTANVAHELRTPLTAMLGEVQVTLRRERAPGAYQQSLRAVEAETSRLASLVEALLTLARTDSGELRATSVAFDLAEAAREAAQRVRSRAGSQRQLEVDADAVAVWGDPVLTGRVLDNLLENAMRHGASRVVLQVRVAGASGVATVWDDGPGLPPSIRQRLFERFNKAPGAGEGFGLGLAIAHALAVAQGGTLELGDGARGARFVLELPAEARASERPRKSEARLDGLAPRPLRD
jgi:signal transduction histidine kinase